ncbi:hypothetical protein [Porcincola intestinalis]|nr:hypothetical protein [Porcincola intestinalis]MDY4204847.1 hypothetical protein [Porcincola intestinalis]
MGQAQLTASGRKTSGSDPENVCRIGQAQLTAAGKQTSGAGLRGPCRRMA